MQTHFWYNGSGDNLKFQFDNPYYVVARDSSVAVTELIFNGSDTINLVNIPEDATKVELFRNGIQLDDMVIDGTEASVNSTAIEDNYQVVYQAFIYNVVNDVKYLLIETPVLDIPFGYRYLAFYGEPSGDLPTFQELELTLTNGTYIKYGNRVDVVPPVETKEWEYHLERNDLSDIFDGDKAWNDRLMYSLYNETSSNRNRVRFYFDCTTKRDVQSGAFWCYPHPTDHSWTIGNLYGTNTDPLNFTDATSPTEWTYIIDLTRYTLGSS